MINADGGMKFLHEFPPEGFCVGFKRSDMAAGYRPAVFIGGGFVEEYLVIPDQKSADTIGENIVRMLVQDISHIEPRMKVVKGTGEACSIIQLTIMIWGSYCIMKYGIV